MGVVHADLKEGNCFLGADLTLALGDMGCGQILDMGEHAWWRISEQTECVFSTSAV